MKKILHLVRRDLAHTCRLLGMFAVLLLLMTWLAITMGSQEGNELVFILNYVIFPSFFVGLAGWLGWKDSRYRENHDLLTRPISLGEMVMAKVVFITGLSVMTALSQSMVNVVLGLEVSLFLLSLTLTLAGLAGYFFTMTLRSGLASPISRVLLICVALLALAMLTNYGMRNWGLRVYGLTNFRVIMAVFLYSLGLFFVHQFVQRKAFLCIATALLVFVCGGVTMLLPHHLKSGDVVAVLESNPGAESPTLTYTLNMEEPRYVHFSSAKMEKRQNVLNQITYRPEQFVLTQSDGSKSVRNYPRWGYANTKLTNKPYTKGFLDQSILELGEITEEQAKWSKRYVAQSRRQSRQSLGFLKVSNLPDDSETVVVSKGKFNHYRFEKIGEIPLEKGAIIKLPELYFEVIEPYLLSDKKRTHSRFVIRGSATPSDGSSLSYLISHPDHHQCQIGDFYLSDEFSIPGISYHSVRNKRFQDLPISGDSLEGWTIKFFQWKFTGSVPYESDPVVYKPKENFGEPAKNHFSEPRLLLTAAEREACLIRSNFEEMDVAELIRFLEMPPFIERGRYYSYSVKQRVYRSIVKRQPEVLLDWIVAKQEGSERSYEAINALTIMVSEEHRDLIQEKAFEHSEFLSLLVARGWIDGLESEVLELARKEAPNLKQGTREALKYFRTREAKELLFQYYTVSFDTVTFDFLHRDSNFRERVLNEIKGHRETILQPDYLNRRGLRNERSIIALVRSGDQEALAKILTEEFEWNFKTQVLQHTLLKHDFSLFARSFGQVLPEPKSFRYDPVRAKFILSKP